MQFRFETFSFLLSTDFYLRSTFHWRGNQCHRLVGVNREEAPRISLFSTASRWRRQLQRTVNARRINLAERWAGNERLVNYCECDFHRRWGTVNKHYCNLWSSRWCCGSITDPREPFADATEKSEWERFSFCRFSAAVHVFVIEKISRKPLSSATNSEIHEMCVAW